MTATPDNDGWIELAERCEAATGPDRELDRDIRDAVLEPCINNGAEYTASLDAAMTLVTEGWSLALHVSENRLHSIATLGRSHPTNANADGQNRVAALALCAAALRARAVKP